MKYKLIIFVLIVLLSSACSKTETTSNSNSAARNSNEPSQTTASRPAAAPPAGVYEDRKSNVKGPEERDRNYLISFQINDSLARNGICDVRARAEYGQVILYGYVDTESDKATAEDIAKRTAGVVDVKNEILLSKRPPVNVNKRGGPKQKCS